MSDYVPDFSYSMGVSVITLYLPALSIYFYLKKKGKLAGCDTVPDAVSVSLLVCRSSCSGIKYRHMTGTVISTGINSIKNNYVDIIRPGFSFCAGLFELSLLEDPAFAFAYNAIDYALLRKIGCW